jgi:Ca2+-binding EF-hand superfamily protein
MSFLGAGGKATGGGNSSLVVQQGHGHHNRAQQQQQQQQQASGPSLRVLTASGNRGSVGQQQQQQQQQQPATSSGDGVHKAGKDNFRGAAAMRSRVQELFQFWAGAPGTQTQVAALVAEALEHIDAGDGGEKCTPDSGSRVHATPGKASPPVGLNTRNPRSGNGATAAPSSAAGSSNAGRQQPQPAKHGDDDDHGSPTIAVSMEDLPSDLGNFALAPMSLEDEPAPSLVMEPVSLSPEARKQPPTKTPRSGANADAKLLGPVTHVVDEMDAAHRAGALSPRCVSPSANNLNMLSMESAQSLLGSRSPMRSPMELPLVDQRNAPLSFNLDGGSSAPRDRSRSVSPTLSIASRQESPRETPRSALLRARRLSADTPPQPVIKPPVATLGDIPAFYFKTGRPSNVPAALASQVGSSEVPSPLSGSGSLASMTAAGGATAALVNAQAQEDREVALMNQIFAQLAASTPSAPGGGARRSVTASRGKRPGTSGGEPHLTAAQALTKLTTEVFRLPAIVTLLLAGKLITTKSPLNLPATRAFYDAHMAKASPDRRLFEVLLGASPAAPVVEGAAPAGKKATAAQAAAAKEGRRRNHLVREDLIPLLQCMIDTHAGLAFLKEASDFQQKYIDTVLIRIFYELDVQDHGKVTWQQFSGSELPAAIRQIDETDDISTVLRFFSYEHFYVVYCRFWDLDEDKDMLISPQDLEKYYLENAVNTLVIERVFKGAGRRLTCGTRNKMNYDDFVWFCLSEEDKSSPRSIRYWFRVLDLDGDGIISGFELEEFYAHTRMRLEQLMGEAITFTDVMCQVSDMLSSAQPADAAQPSDSAPMSTPMLEKTNSFSRPPTGRKSKNKTPLATTPTPRQLFSTTAASLTSPAALKARGVTLKELLASPMAACVALNMITNVAKFIQFEQRDPFVVQHERLQGAVERSEWDRFCRTEYDRLASAEEGGDM